MTHYACPKKLYKYLSCNGLEKTLQNRSLKLSRPTDFNDPLDLFVREALGMDEIEFLEGIKTSLLEYIFGDIDYDTLRDSPNKHKIVLLNMAFKNNPDAVEKIKKEVIETPISDLYDLEAIRRDTKMLVDFINALLRNDGIFCSTTDSNNLLMWAHYADHHRGAVIELTPSVEKDSALLVSKEIHYTDVRPLLYQDPIDMIARGLTMSTDDTAQIIFYRVIYTKSKEWSYEKEFRLTIHRFIPDNREYGTLDFYAEELTALYLGCRMKLEDRRRAIGLAKNINPSIDIFEARIVPREFRLEYVTMPDF